MNGKLNNGASGIVPENAGKVNGFDSLKRTFESAFASGDYGKPLQNLARAVALSVVKKCIDPQRKSGGGDSASDGGYNSAMLDLRRDIMHDSALLDNISTTSNAATETTYNDKGDAVTAIADKAAHDALSAIISNTIGDGYDLVQTAALELLEQAADHADSPGWLDRPYTVRRLARRVYIRRTDSAAYRDEKTTPIQEVYRAVRRAIMDSRAVKTDPANGYTYIDGTTADGTDSILYRMDRFADIGGADCHGLYTGSADTAGTISDIMDGLSLTKRQEAVIRLRTRGYGYKAIASYLGIDVSNVKRTARQVQEKAEKIGFTPGTWKEMTENNG